MNKKIISVLLVLSMLVGMLAMLPITIGAADEITYDITIENKSDWLALCASPVDGKNVIVTAETLDFTGEDISPIKFSNGEFNGNGVVITGVNIKNSGDAGLFHEVVGATIKNIVIENSSFEVTSNWVGALVCCIQDSTIKNVYVKDTVTVKAETGYAGGLIGGMYGGTNTVYVTACVFEGTVESNGDGGNGGIMGSGNSSSSNNHTIVIERCLVTGRVPNDVTNSCGFVGCNGKGGVTMTNCIYAGGAEDDYFYNRPFFRDTMTPVVEGCYTTHVAKNGVYNDVKISSLDESVVKMVDKEDLIGLDAIEIEGWVRRDGAIMIPDTTEAEPITLRGEGTYGSPYLIGSAEEWDIFYTLSKQGNDFDGEYVELDSNIDFDGATLHPVFCEMCGSKKGFKGSFDGRGYALSNFTIDSKEDSASLFGVLDGGAVVENLVISNATIAVKNYGAVVAGGIRNDGNTIKNIYVASDVVVTGERYIGGIVGSTYSSATGLNVNNCIFAGSINATKDYIGGIIGSGRDATISYCMNTGRVSGSTIVSGMSTAEKSLTISNCVNTGIISAQGSYWGDIYAGNPKADSIVIENCYYIDTLMRTNSEGGGSVTAENNNKAEFADLIGLDASIPSGFTARAGDFAVPTDCTVAPSILLTQHMVDGASVRLDTPTGLRFKAVLGKAFLESFGDGAIFGIIITPTEYIAEAGGEFTVEALDKLDNHSTDYILVPAEKLLSGGDEYGYYEFSAVLANVLETNYNRAFSARAYVMVDGKIVYYSEYNSDVNSRSIADVAKAAYNDTSKTQNDEYKYEISANAGVYSPYTEAQRDLLTAFFGQAATNVNLMTYNIRNVEGGDSALGDPLTFEYDKREDAVVNYIISANPDVIGIQEASVKTHAHDSSDTLSWFDTLAKLEANGYACFKGNNILPSGDNKEMYNPIYYKADKYDLVGSGFAYLSDDGTQKAYDGEYRGVTYVVLEDNTTGLQFVYVNVHMTRASGGYQDDVAGYLKTFLESLDYECPIFIGGDFNGSYSDYKGYDTFWGETALSARDEATNKTSQCSTTNDNFDGLGTSSGPIDLYFALNAENVDFHNYAVTDNKVETTGKYPSDHLPVKLVVTIYGDKTAN